MSVQPHTDIDTPESRLTSHVERYLDATHQVLDIIPLGQVARLAELIIEVATRGNMIYVFGNGGSAATASHMACDLSKNTRTSAGPSVRCICLASCVPMLSALANDDGYEDVFAGSLRVLGRPGDLALAISASGNSPNVLQALRAARSLEMQSAALLGYAGGLARELVDLPVVVNADSIEHIEDCHSILNHMLTASIRALLSL